MAREDLHFRLRIPEQIKEQIEKSAQDNHRSMTAEIVARLDASLSGTVASEKVERLELENHHLRELYGAENALRLANERLEIAQRMIVYEFADAIRRAALGDDGKLQDLIAREKHEPMLHQFKAARDDEETS
ncbi:Arc family DNA-binding protein [Aureimonas altamirensis]|uniref:Arc family DNA-binding protein n=1 Tax=Aureimonas altamirensis TaxID=370622 RepID=UPI001E567485|nr:Arc family DNA-binding protein [Aureimonas altamirensis]UHD44933.1 Arc family DNA-binding protein [Aureimonas altamirensis]